MNFTRLLNNRHPPPEFKYILFERANPERNEQRFYYLAYLPALFDGPAVVRIWGRKGRWQKATAPRPFLSLDEAWPEIRKHIRARLRHGYRVVEPLEYREEENL